MERLRELTAYAVLVVGAALSVVAFLPDLPGNAPGAVLIALVTACLVVALAAPP